MEDIKILLNYNFNPLDIADNDFESLFKKRRRDSCFAFVYQKDDKIYAIRDHIGTIPLYFRKTGSEVKFSININSLTINHSDILEPEGVRHFIAFGTPKLKPLLNGIKIVPPGSVMEIDLNRDKYEIIYRYKINKPSKDTTLFSLDEYVNRLDNLFTQAIKRTVKFDKVGLYLSGGIDSGLTGIYLRKLGIKINAYTSAPWGEKSSEIPFAKINAKSIGVEKHDIISLESNQYKEMISHIPILYGAPHGTTTAIGVASLWKKSQINNEKQIYAAQGCDTETCSVPVQSLVFFLRFLPKILRHKLNKNLGGTFLEDYFSFATNSLLNNYKELEYYIDPSFSARNLLILAGLYLVHSPSDGEVLSGPVINHNIIFSNPFYDIDLIEFFLRIPLRYCLAFSKDSKIKISLDKIIVRKLAERYFPKDLVWRKKGFTISLDRDKRTKFMLDNLPSSIYGISLKDKNSEFRFRAKILFDWCKVNGIRISL